MFNNLKAEFIRNNVQPYMGVALALKCSERSARNRLNGSTDFTVSEAMQIKKSCFPDLTIDYLFSEEEEAKI